MTTQPIRYAEDYKVGDAFDLGEHTITKEEIVEFASQWDPQPFHTDETFARESVFGGLIDSGWHVALILHRLLLQSGFISPQTSLGSPGADGLKWRKPVRPGDRLSGRIEVTDVKISRSRPELGFVTTEATLRNQDGDEVYWLKSAAIIKTRAANRN